MLETNPTWSLFGYDVRQAWYFFTSGWRDFLWGADSPVLPLVDETVAIYKEDGGPFYVRTNKSVPQPTEAELPKSSALVLPEHLVLPRILLIPKIAEGSLESVVEMEVKANSPFPEGDTCFGWKLVKLRDDGLEVQLVISSFSTIMEYIAQRLDSHDIRSYEVWAQVGSNTVVLSGFGEAPRRKRNQTRMILAGAAIAYCMLIVVGCFGVAAGMKFLELQRVNDIYSDSQQRAAHAVQLRTALSAGNRQIAAMNALLLESSDPRAELARLSRLIDDSSWLSQVDISGKTIRINGSSLNAASVMQKLIDEPAYEEVLAPAAIRKDRRNGTERFVLDITLARPGDTP